MEEVNQINIFVAFDSVDLVWQGCSSDTLRSTKSKPKAGDFRASLLFLLTLQDLNQTQKIVANLTILNLSLCSVFF